MTRRQVFDSMLVILAGIDHGSDLRPAGRSAGEAVGCIMQRLLDEAGGARGPLYYVKKLLVLDRYEVRYIVGLNDLQSFDSEPPIELEFAVQCFKAFDGIGRPKRQVKSVPVQLQQAA